MARVITEHEEIRQWFAARGGNPAIAEHPDGMGGTHAVLRLLFGTGEIEQQSDLLADRADGRAAPVGWDEWLEEFDKQNLALRVPDHGNFHDGRFEFVNRNDLEE